MSNHLTQREQVKKYLQEGNAITPAIALAEFGAFRLATIIHRLRHEDGMKISTTIKRSFSGRPYAEYKLERS